MKLNFSLLLKWTLLVWDQSSDALRFYETVEIGTVRALGEHVIGLLFGLSFTFCLFYRDFRGRVMGLKCLSKNSSRNNEHLVRRV